MSNSNSAPRIITLIFTTAVFFLLSSFSTASDSLSNDVLSYTNQFRKSKGKTVLTMRDDLNKIARKHSEDMASGRRSFGHGGYDQRSKKIRQLYQSCSIAENVAYGATSAKEVVDQWKNSPNHRTNMLGNYKYIGIGAARDRKGRYYYTQIFVR